ncbi:GNAT family N-acetyltransferase [Methyloceanibacter sp. wino2]|uniref:GNAT family N-acetyltransferase n=1 Tax=Methyloceanibacter sp. wino2 TaxID=2170729 RepID=UPI00131F1D38|nr:GNAT family N-acetyltransferase [Methyloceanibacter sp. wino2]
MDHSTTVLIFEAPVGSGLYRDALRLREDILRRPLGLTVSSEELADDSMRQHFCAVDCGAVVGTVSLRPLDETTLHLKQMAVVEPKRAARIGSRLVAHVERWGTSAGFRLMVAHARVGAEGFYLKHGYAQEGAAFFEQTIPHVRVTKRLR